MSTSSSSGSQFLSFASAVSTLAEPTALIVGLIILAGWRVGLREWGFYSFVLYVLIFFLSLFFLRLRTVRTLKTNWDISDHRARVRSIGPLVVISLFWFAGIVFWKNDALMRTALVFFFWLLGFAAATSRMKISGHMGILVLCIGLLIVWYGSVMNVLLPLTVLVAWSRLVLKRHTTIEIVLGTAYSVVFLFVVSFSGLLS